MNGRFRWFFRIVIILSLSVTCVSLAGQVKDSGMGHEVDVKIGQREKTVKVNDLFRFNMGYSTNRYGLMEVTWHHFLSPNVALGGGVSCGLAYLGDKMPGGYRADQEYDSWREMSGDEEESLDIEAMGPKFLFSGIFKTPDLLRFKHCSVFCLVEPGAVFSVPYSGRDILLSNESGDTATEHVHGWGGRWFFWQCRGTLMFNFDDFGIGLSYSMNDIDMYSTLRTLEYDGQSFDDFYHAKKPFYHTFGLTLSYSF